MSNVFRIGEAIENMQLDKPKVQTWIFDPPYNIGFKYDNFNDRMNDDQYKLWIKQVAQNMYNNTLEGGSCFLIHYNLIGAKLIEVFESVGWLTHQWITWVYPHNMGMSKKRFTQGSRVVLWFSKGDPYVNIKAVKGEYKNPNDKRIKEKIKEGHYPALMDWWNINLRKNVSKGHRGYANQLPYELVKRCILTTSKENQIIGDCMAGSGTTYEVSKKFNRYVWMNDINPNCFKIWEGIE